MIPQTKSFFLMPTIAATAGDTHTATFSRLDYDYAVIDLGILGTEAAASTKPPTEIILSDSDGTTYAAVKTGGTDFTLPTALKTVGEADKAGTVVRFAGSLVGRGKNLKVAVASATKGIVAIHVTLFKGHLAPTTAALQNVGTLVSF